MKIGVICGSQRPGSNTAKIGHLIENKLKHTHRVSVYFLDLGSSKLGFWDGDDLDGEDSVIAKQWAQIDPHIRACNAYVIVSPEWGGMVPAALKNFFLYCNKHQLRHKPGLIVSVSTGVGGSYPIAELRVSSYKNTGICYLPDQVIFRNVNSFLDDVDKRSSIITKSLDDRLNHLLEVLVLYAEALAPVRAKIDFNLFPNGM